MNGLPGGKVLDYDAFNAPNSGPLGLGKPAIQRITVRVPNRSGVSVQPLGYIAGQTSYRGCTLGWMQSLNSVNLFQGDNVVVMEGPIVPSNVTIFSEVLSRFLVGDTTMVTLTLGNYSTEPNGTDVSVPVPASSVSLYADALVGIEVPLGLKWPTGRVNMSTEVVMDVAAATKSGTNTIIPIWLGLYNPFSCDIILRATNFAVTWNYPPAAAVAAAAAPAAPAAPAAVPAGTTLAAGLAPVAGGAYVGQTYNTDQFLVLAPNARTLTSTTSATSLVVTVPLSAAAASAALLSVLRDVGHTAIGVHGNFLVQAGNLPLNMNYHQAINVPACDLGYTATHKRGGACSFPSTWNLSTTPP
jgi:hypothetical protein